MTPEWASQLLEHNAHNRAPRAKAVAQIASDITTGRWQLTPQTVSIANNGTLLDGQHRLMAIVKSGRAVPLMLATDCPAECFSAIDTGMARTPGDILKIDGCSQSVSVAAIIRTVFYYKHFPGHVWSGAAVNQNTITKQHLVDHYRSDTDGWEVAVKAAAAVKRFPYTQLTAIGAFMYLYASEHAPDKSDKEKSKEYLRLFCTGEMLPAGNPVLAFRNWQASQWKIAYVKKVQTQLACHIKAYKYWKDGAELKIFKQPQIPPMPQL